jgi:tetratricopeptide (TPR) repeat protein
MAPIAGYGMREKGLLRLGEGDLDAAEEAFRAAHARGSDPQPGLARLWLLQGKASAALNALTRALADAEGQPLARAKLLPTLVEAALETGACERAQAAVAELEEIADRFISPGFRAEALAARGALELAQGEHARAGTTLRRAIRAWQEIGAPYEVARLRRLLASAHEAEGDADAAALEREAARDAFSRLGAAADLARTPTPLERTVDARAVTRVSEQPGAGWVIDGKLEIVGRLGEGGMGSVYAARHRLLGRDVAVMLLRPGGCEDPRQCQRLLQEALASGQVRHPNVVEVYDAGIDGGAPYLVLELLRGESVGDRLARHGPLACDEALEIVAQALAGVAAAHAHGIVHRDLKPDNLFLVEGDAPRVKVLDFGIAKLQDGGGMAETGTGALVGTPYYMAPEQIEGRRDLDARVDVYALGVVLFELLTGDRPFRGDSYGALLLSIVTAEFPSCRERRPDLPERVDALIRTATARDRSVRFRTAREFADAVAELRA